MKNNGKTGFKMHLWNESLAIRSTTLIKQSNQLLLPGSRWSKRFFDYAVTIGSLPFTLPIMLFIAAAIKLTSKGRVFYTQARLGEGGATFRAYKFRTMRPDADEVLEKYLAAHPGLRMQWELHHKLLNDPRVTWVGKLLRKSSLDELPQLFNVLRGEMSLVGPRPIVQEEIRRYGEAFDLYCTVLPGITGLWQVSGRNNTSYGERVGFDEFYVRNWSPWLDLDILLRTFKVVILREGAY
jgi:Undecaprenyl-phosphate galactose phosphotransferase WbaP